jgi:hypothetical protein
MPETEEEKVAREAKEAEDKKKAEGGVTNEQIVTALRYLNAENQSLKEEMKGLKAAPPVKDDDKATPPTANPDDVEKMNNAELSAHIGDSILARMKKELIDPLTKQISDLDGKSDRRMVSDDVAKAQEKYADFGQFTNEIAAMIKEKPDLSVDEAYALSKHNNPAKVEELEKVAAEQAAKEKSEKESTEFGGLLPTSGLTAKNDEMTMKDASEAAFNEIFVGTPLEKMLQ